MVRFKPFLLGVCLLQTVMAFAVLLKSPPAAACSPPPSPSLYYTFAEPLPGDGATEMALDGMVLLTSRAWRIESLPTHTPELFESVLSVTVTAVETGESIPGKLHAWLGEPYGVAWRPEQPLLPNRRYELVGTLRQSTPRPAEAQGSTELRRSFSTGTRMAPPLELQGGLDVRLESYEKETPDCAPAEGSCGCKATRTVTSTRARVRVPGVQGGDALGAYRFELWVTDRTPYQFDKRDQHPEHDVLWGVWGVNTAGDSAETLFGMPEHDEAYKPCFAWRVLDPAGHIQEGAPVCLNETVEPSSGFLGCTVAWGSTHSRSTAFLALLGTLALAWRVRRPNAPSAMS